MLVNWRILLFVVQWICSPNIALSDDIEQTEVSLCGEGLLVALFFVFTCNHVL